MKLTKSGLRSEQVKLNQLKMYLPTLQLKKAMLQTEVNATKNNIDKLYDELLKEKSDIENFCELIVPTSNYNIFDFTKIKHVNKKYENIAGVEIPIFEDVVFVDEQYFLFDTPSWSDIALVKLKKMISLKERIGVEEEKKTALEKESREVSIRVNLFEKILIPRTLTSIKKISIFLGDQQLAAVSQAKVAKTKILEKQNDE
jgi:V/A-type H+-transporting ATPase subunit D